MRDPAQHNVEGTFTLEGATQAQLDGLKQHCEQSCDCKCEVGENGVCVITGPADGFESARAGVNLIQADIHKAQAQNGNVQGTLPDGVRERWERQAKAFAENRDGTPEDRTPQTEMLQTETGTSFSHTVQGVEQPKAAGSVGQAGGMGAGLAEVDPNSEAGKAMGGFSAPPPQNIAHMKEAGIQPATDVPGQEIDDRNVATRNPNTVQTGETIPAGAGETAPQQ
jgi:hypothetical protein